MRYHEGDTCKNCGQSIYRLVTDTSRGPWRHNGGDVLCTIIKHAEPSANWGK
jgi:hypothetical protein